MSKPWQMTHNGVHLHAEPNAAATRFCVRAEGVFLGVLVVSHDSNHTHWHCSLCTETARNKWRMGCHLIDEHFWEMCRRVGGIAPTIIPIRQVRTNERRSRMPWRVEAPEYK